MTPDGRNPSIHAIKYYRVVLEEINPNKTSPASFSIKLSMRTRTPRPRVEHVLRQLPYTIKSGLTVDQANRLKSMLEDLGGIARLESYVVEPGERPTSGADRGAILDLMAAAEGPTGSSGKKVCETCGWSEPEDVEICSLCLEPFPKRSGMPAEVKERTGGGNPPAEMKQRTVDDPHRVWGDADSTPPASAGATDWKAMLERHQTAILIGAVLLLVVLLILK